TGQSEKLYLFQLGFSLQEEELRRMASAEVAAQFGFQLVRRNGEWDKENPTAHPENGQRLAGYVGNYRTFETDPRRVHGEFQITLKSRASRHVTVVQHYKIVTLSRNPLSVHHLERILHADERRDLLCARRGRQHRTCC